MQTNKQSLRRFCHNILRLRKARAPDSIKILATEQAARRPDSARLCWGTYMALGGVAAAKRVAAACTFLVGLGGAKRCGVVRGVAWRCSTGGSPHRLS